MTPMISEQLREAAASLADEQVSIGELLEAHGPAARGSLLLLLAVPCMLPIPGTGTVLGIGVLALAVAIWRGQPEAALPRRVSELAMSRHWGQRVLQTLATLYALAARVVKARSCRLMPECAAAWLAAPIAAMAVVLILPIPFGNILPALVLILIGLGMAFRDNLAVLLGALAAALTTAAMATVLLMAADWGIDGVTRLFA
jgi:hypothetical protein